MQTDAPECQLVHHVAILLLAHDVYSSKCENVAYGGETRIRHTPKIRTTRNICQKMCKFVAYAPGRRRAPNTRPERAAETQLTSSFLGSNTSACNRSKRLYVRTQGEIFNSLVRYQYLVKQKKPPLNALKATFTQGTVTKKSLYIRTPYTVNKTLIVWLLSYKLHYLSTAKPTTNECD